MTNYLRNRPFMVVELKLIPAEHSNTRVKGWDRISGAYSTIKKVSFVDRIKSKNRYAIAIDLLNASVIINGTAKSNDEILESFLSEYKEDVKTVLSQYSNNLKESNE